MQSVQIKEKSVSIAVLTIDDQSIKPTFINQLQEAEFEDVFTLVEGNLVFAENCTPWGWVRTIDSDVVLTEIKGVLYGNTFSEPVVHKPSCEEACFLQWLYGEGSVLFVNGRFEFRDGSKELLTLNDQGKENFNSYISLIRSLPQLFLV
jgi:hypothetical protein